ncbi:Sec-independent protein translocase subunit TatA [Kitasatospora sp. NPDC003701]
MFRNGLEPWHLIIVLAVLVLLFGSKKLPEAARGLGKSLRILKAETKAMHEDTPTDDADPAPAILPPPAEAEPSTQGPAVPTASRPSTSRDPSGS